MVKVWLRPDRVTTDKHTSYPRAIRHILGRKVRQHTSRYLNNRIEQHHRSIKQRYYPMRGFGSFASAAQFCAAFDEIRPFFRIQASTAQPPSLLKQRQTFHQRWIELQAIWQPN